MAERESLFFPLPPKPPPQVSPPRKKVLGRREKFSSPLSSFLSFPPTSFLPFLRRRLRRRSLIKVNLTGGSREGKREARVTPFGFRFMGQGGWKKGFWATLEFWTLLSSTLCGPRVHFNTFSTRRIFSCIFPHVLQVECIRRQDVFDLFWFLLLVPARAADGA